MEIYKGITKFAYQCVGHAKEWNLSLEIEEVHITIQE